MDDIISMDSDNENVTDNMKLRGNNVKRRWCDCARDRHEV